MKKLLISLFLLLPLMASADEKNEQTAEQQSGSIRSKLHFDINYNLNMGLAQTLEGKTFNRNDYTMWGDALYFAVRYDATPRLSAGVGIGSSRYTEPSFNTFPVYATLQYKPFKNKERIFAYADLGYSVKFTSDSYAGFTGGIGMGYRWKLGTKSTINLTVGYDLKEFRDIDMFLKYDIHNKHDKTNSVRHTLSIGVGVTF
ncbi:MAG: hypothetical protein U0K35_05440 [Prevotella sp.]|nr:hypothetical protein [Prevotella sp.]